MEQAGLQALLEVSPKDARGEQRTHSSDSTSRLVEYSKGSTHRICQNTQYTDKGDQNFRMLQSLSQVHINVKLI